MFLEMFSRWESTAGKLAHEDPRILLRIIELSSIKGGISQRNLQQELKINQPRLSKLTKKLARNLWVQIRRSAPDHRVVLTIATALGKGKARDFRTELATMIMMNTQAVPKKRKVAKPSVYKGPSLL